MSEIVRRIEREIGVPNLSGILAERIEPTDLQSLLLEVYKKRVKNRKPSTVFSDYVSSNFTSSSSCDPVLLLEWDRTAFAHLPDEFIPIELSPVSPLGSVSCMAPVSQDWVFTTIRNIEVVADPTNVLALECARQRQEIIQYEPRNAHPIHLACSHRVARAQRYQDAGARQHFRVFSLCSAGRDKGNFRFEIDALIKHIRFYIEALRDFLGSSVHLRVAIFNLSPDSYKDTVVKTPIENLGEEFKEIYFDFEKTPARKTGYYHNLRFHIYASATRGNELELVDGGDTNWTQKLLNNAKERLVISGIGSERLCENFKLACQQSSKHKH